MAYGGSQARGLFGAEATNLQHSHSVRSEPHLRPMPQLTATPDTKFLEITENLGKRHQVSHFEYPLSLQFMQA